VPLDLRHHAARHRPALRLIAEVGVVAADLDGRASAPHASNLNPDSPDEDWSCKVTVVDSDIGVRSLCHWIEGNHGAPSG
jgi:hypothetical protein